MPGITVLLVVEKIFAINSMAALGGQSTKHLHFEISFSYYLSCYKKKYAYEQLSHLCFVSLISYVKSKAYQSYFKQSSIAVISIDKWALLKYAKFLKFRL